MKKFLCIFLAASFLFSLTGCKNKEVPPIEQIVATVNGANIIRGEVEETLMQELSSQYGSYLYMLGEDYIDQFRSQYSEQILEMLIQNEVARQKAREFGLYELTDEEKKETDESFKNTYDQYIEYFTEQLKQEDAEGGMIEADIKAKDYSGKAKDEMIKFLEENQKHTLDKFDGETYIDKFRNLLIDSFVVSRKLFNKVTEDVTVTDDAVQTRYNTMLAEQKEAYDKDITKYEEDYQTNLSYRLNYGYTYDYKPLVYVPEGLRFVKHILINYSEETSEKLKELYQTMNADKAAVTTAEEALEDAEGDTAKKAAEDTLKEAKDKYDASAKKYNDDLEKAKKEIVEKVETINDKVKAGEDFDKLIAEHGEDPGMKEEGYKGVGYILSDKTTGYAEEFSKAGMALKNVGDFSDPVYTVFGAHIMQLASFLKSREVPLDEVKSDIKDILLNEAKNKKFSDLLTEWTDDQDVTRDKDSLTAPLTSASPSNT